MRFHVADTLTGRIVGQLHPSSFELVDPLRGAGTGSLVLPAPPADQVRHLRDLTLPRRRWVAVEDDQGRFLWGGPIPRHPARTQGTVTVPLVDWRSWFYRAPIRPNADGSRRNYIRKGRDQALIMADLFAIALDTAGAPNIVIDAPAASGVSRDIMALMLDRSVGEWLDSIQNRERGSEWHTYVTRDTTDPTRLVVHAAVSYPERQSRTSPVKVEWRLGKGGNVHDYAWPEGMESPTRVWAVGDGEPPDQAWAMDETLDINDGVDVAWEDTLGPLDGVTRKATAYEYAYAFLAYGRGLSGTAEFSVTDAAVPIGDYATGDRARVVLDDGWDTADVAAARIIERVVTGGRGVPLSCRIKVDLANDEYGDTSTVPGEAVGDA